MKKLLLIVFLTLPSVSFAQGSLSKLLWSRVNSCYSMFEDMDEDGTPDFDKIDDARNGYLQISGAWPTCGCSCTSTVGAFKNSQGEYVILQSDEAPCSWKKEVSSNHKLSEILPADLNLHTLTSGKISKSSLDYAFLFLNVEIPRIGTDTKVKIELVPLGLKPGSDMKGESAVAFSYREPERISDHKFLYRLISVIRDAESEKTLDYMLSGEFDKITDADRKLIKKAIGEEPDKFESEHEIRAHLSELKEIHTVYKSLSYSEIILGWNRTASRFYIKEKKNKPTAGTFREFLKNKQIWSPVC